VAPRPHPAKHVSVLRFPLIDPLVALSTLGDVSIRVQDHEVNNLFIVSVIVSNSGHTPILPDDYYEKLAVSVDKPWRIFAFQESEIVPGVSLHWKSAGPRKYEAECVLLNPGDAALLTIYLVNDEIGDPDAEIEAPVFHWNARITNLQEITEEMVYPSPLEGVTGIVVLLYGWGLWFTIAVAIGFQVVYLHLFARCGLFEQWNWKGMLLIVLSGLISCAAAECISMYLVGGYMSDTLGVPHKFNVPPIVLNGILLAFLWWKAQRMTRKIPAHEAGNME
jgi:hypothetical protein